MTIALQCRCGKLQGTVDAGQAYTRCTCYCRDCQAYLQHLDRSELLDRCGGTDIVPMSPRGVRITQGIEHLSSRKNGVRGKMVSGTISDTAIMVRTIHSVGNPG